MAFSSDLETFLIIKEFNSLINNYKSNIQKRSANPSENDDSLDQDFCF
jgi:hypothetical protein